MILKMKMFDDLSFKPHSNHLGGVHSRMMFENGYGVSVVKTSFSYGGSEGLYELAVLYKDSITYNTPITDDVLGWLTEEDVSRVMGEIQSL
jgi:hypothetical protein